MRAFRSCIRRADATSLPEALRLAQVFLNLLSNAAKFTDDRGDLRTASWQTRP
ncbi:MAG: hypothetical protein ACREU1_12230 [Burkholderiales bacterium]